MSALGSLGTLYLIACHAGPASHFATFAEALEKKGYSVCLYASGPALQKYQELGIEANPFGVNGTLDAHVAADLAQRCAQAAAVITDVGHPFAIVLQQELKEKAPLRCALPTTTTPSLMFQAATPKWPPKSCSSLKGPCLPMRT